MKYPAWAVLADKWTILGGELISESFHGQREDIDRERMCLVGEAFFENRPILRPLAEVLPEPWRSDALALLEESTRD